MHLKETMQKHVIREIVNHPKAWFASSITLKLKISLNLGS